VDNEIPELVHAEKLRKTGEVFQRAHSGQQAAQATLTLACDITKERLNQKGAGGGLEEGEGAHGEPEQGDEG
jgi:hypothetical protein